MNNSKLFFTTSFRRYYLDKFLMGNEFRGDVLDIGGKKESKRGCFDPKETGANSWRYLNIDNSTQPDFLCSADNIPLPDENLDTIVMSEVIEHLESPFLVLKETYRLLKKEGSLFASIPFLFPVHADPNDFQRWTKIKIISELRKAGYNEIEVLEMGGIFAVTYDLFRFSYKNKFSRALLKICRPLVFLMEKTHLHEHTTTGYFIKATK